MIIACFPALPVMSAVMRWVLAIIADLNSGIDPSPFVRRHCSDTLQNITCDSPMSITTSGRRSGPSFFVQTAAFVFALALLSGVAVAQRAATRQAPKNAEQFYAQGVALLRRGDSVRAVASLRSALRLKPDFAEAHNALGLALGGQGQIEAAINSFREAARFRRSPRQSRPGIAAKRRTRPRDRRASRGGRSSTRFSRVPQRLRIRARPE